MWVAPSVSNVYAETLARYREVYRDVLRDDGTSVIVGHDVFRTNHNIIPSLDDLSSRKPDGVLLHDLLDHSLGDLGRMRREQPDAS